MLDAEAYTAPHPEFFIQIRRALDSTNKTERAWFYHPSISLLHYLATTLVLSCLAETRLGREIVG